ncbi:MAG TPA: hypothetical protein VFH49_13685, partial [Aquabacterium sp.]|nr:hypothetical protein [Aquabacterium sp.]
MKRIAAFHGVEQGGHVSAPPFALAGALTNQPSKPDQTKHSNGRHRHDDQDHLCRVHDLPQHIDLADDR